jgi:nucleoside-diphosphate-sugar epimerase
MRVRTGSTGLLGNNLVRALEAAGHSVVGLVRSEEKGRRLLDDTRATLVKGDMRDVPDFACVPRASDGLGGACCGSAAQATGGRCAGGADDASMKAAFRYPRARRVGAHTRKEGDGV